MDLMNRCRIQKASSESYQSPKCNLQTTKYERTYPIFSSKKKNLKKTTKAIKKKNFVTKGTFLYTFALILKKIVKEEEKEVEKMKKIKRKKKRRRVHQKPYQIFFG